MRNTIFKKFKNDLLKDKKIKRAYEEFGSEFGIIKMVIKRRIALIVLK